MSEKEYENVWVECHSSGGPQLQDGDGNMAPWSTADRACHYVDSAAYDAQCAEIDRLRAELFELKGDVNYARPAASAGEKRE
jgi:hypothetical protein